MSGFGCRCSRSSLYRNHPLRQHNAAGDADIQGLCTSLPRNLHDLIRYTAHFLRDTMRFVANKHDGFSIPVHLVITHAAVCGKRQQAKPCFFELRGRGGEVHSICYAQVKERSYRCPDNFVVVQPSGRATSSLTGRGKCGAASSENFSASDRKMAQSLFDSQHGGMAAESG